MFLDPRYFKFFNTLYFPYMIKYASSVCVTYCIFVCENFLWLSGNAWFNFFFQFNFWLHYMYLHEQDLFWSVLVLCHTFCKVVRSFTWWLQGCSSSCDREGDAVWIFLFIENFAVNDRFCLGVDGSAKQLNMNHIW